MTTDANGGGDQGISPGGAPPSGADTTLAPGGQPAASWFSSIDFGDAKESATAALSKYKTPQDLVGELQKSSDWRRLLAGDDEKEYAYLQRFSTQTDYHKSGIEARKKISAGELAKPLPKDATPEQIKAYREGNGIPEKPEGYREQLPSGLVIGEDDVPIIDSVLAGPLHKHNIRPEVAHEIIQAYYKFQDQQIQAQQQADAETKKAFESKLQEVWGGDFKPNANIYSNFLAAAPKEVQAKLTTARDGDGNFILYDPAVVSWITNQAREINPAGHIVPAGGDGTLVGYEAERKQILDVMSKDRPRYNKDAAMQARLTQLNGAIEALQKRGRAA